MNRLKIDQVAMQSGLTKRAVRYYEEIGILPAPERIKGIRYYTEDHVELLKKIKYTKDALGISLEELQNFVSFSKTIDAQKAGYKLATERVEQKQKLITIISNLNEEINLIDQKILKINKVRSDLINLKERAQVCVEKIIMEERES